MLLSAGVDYPDYKKQVELADLSDGVLSFLIEFMLQGLRQFLTHEERLKAELGGEAGSASPPHFGRPHRLREHYFTALNTLREHLSGALAQIAIIAGIAVPHIPEYLRVQTWNTANYITDESKSDSNH